MTLMAVMMPQELILEKLEEHLQDVKLGVQPLEHLMFPCTLIMTRIVTKGDLENALNFNEELEATRRAKNLLKPDKN